MEPVNPPIKTIQYNRGGRWQPNEIQVIAETQVSLTVNGEVWLSFACTPTDLEALAVGFLFNEGILETMDEVAAVRVCKNKENVDVWLRHPVKKPASWQRTSGCSGGLTRADNHARPKTMPACPRLSPQSVLDGMEQMLASQDLYRQARGVHCSALSDGKRIRLQAEDIGRHNTLDKLAGLSLMVKERTDGWMVLTTGRVSSEMLQKSVRMGAALVVSRTSPTSQSVRAAEELGITLVGYARRTQFSIYAHPERLGLGVVCPTAASHPAQHDTALDEDLSFDDGFTLGGGVSDPMPAARFAAPEDEGWGEG